MKNSILGVIIATALLNTSVYAADYGEGVAAYNTNRLPDKPVLNSTPYYPTAKTSAAIQSAIDMASASGGGTVKLDSGTYSVRYPITLKSNVRVQGKGMGVTILKRTSDFSRFKDTYIIGAENGSVRHSELRGFTVDGGFDNDELKALEPHFFCIQMSSSSGFYNKYFRVFSVEAKGCGGGLNASGTTHIRVEFSKFHDNGGHYLYHNIYFRRTGYLLFLSNSIYDSVLGSGLKLAGGTSHQSGESRFVTIRGNNVYNNERINLNIQGMHHLLIENNRIKSQNVSHSHMAGIYLVNYEGYACRYTDIINNKITDNTGLGLYMKGCNTVSVQGNKFENNAKGNYLISDSNTYKIDE